MNNTMNFIEGSYLDCSVLKDWILQGKAVMSPENEIVIDHTDGKAGSIAILPLILNQKRAAQIRLQAESIAEGVECVNAYEYSILQKVEYCDGTNNFLDWVPFNDGSLHYANYAAFTQGTHDWEKCSLVFIPEKPVRKLDLHLYFQNGTGKVRFRNVRMQNADVQNDLIFDTFPVQVNTNSPVKGLYLRDIKQNPSELFPMADSGEINQINWTFTEEKKGNQQYYRLHLKSTDKQDHVFTVYYMIPLPGDKGQPIYSVKDMLTVQPICEQWDYFDVCPWSVGANGLQAHFPITAAVAGDNGRAIGFDPSYPVFGRVGCNGAIQCLYLAADLALTAEKNEIDLLFNTFDFDGRNGFRGALDSYYKMFPAFYNTRIKDQGNWMAFVPISSLKDFEDFGFKFKEGHDEPGWDREHGIYTFRYTEPLTCWIHMNDDPPSCKADAVNYVQKQQDKQGKKPHVISSCSMHDVNGNDILILMDRPWCNNGAVWSINSMPGIPDECSDFNLKWNKKLQNQYYTPGTAEEVSGEYIDSSEGYVTADISHRRDHFAYAGLPLSFGQNNFCPGIFKGSIVYEYAKEMRDFVLPRGKYMMANGTPGAMWYLPALLDVVGTETDWCINGKWAPVTLEEFCYRRSACAAKPYCFLMNTNFKYFTHEMVEKYMKRSGAFGMFPSFFSANAASDHYFTQPDLYERDRPLFKKYMPVIRRVAESGWEPVTLAETEQKDIHLERFGTRYITVINDNKKESVEAEILLQLNHGDSCRDEYTGNVYSIQDNRIRLSLEPEAVLVLNLLTE